MTFKIQQNNDMKVFAAKLLAACRYLRAQGWKQELSLMADSVIDGKFGVLFARYNPKREEFWLNYKTVDNLPK